MTNLPSNDDKPAVALGTMGMTGCYGPVAEAQAVDTIRRFLDLGGSWIDTADLYGDGLCEEIVGRAIDGRRDCVSLCTKFGYTFGRGLASRGLDARPERAEPACDASLARLGIDVIDIYYLHRVDPKVPIEDTWGAMARLVEKGKVRALGLCEVSARTYERAAAIHPVAIVQSEYSLWSREPEDGMLDLCQRRGSAFFGYAPLGRGFLSGNLKSPADFGPDDQRRNYPRFMGENFKRNLDLVDALGALAAELGANAAQLAVAWCRRLALATPIVGATEPAHVDDAMRGVALDVSPSQWARLDAVFPKDAIAGERYPEAAMKRLDSRQPQGN
jgi:aryl-alcohol dehydrogenase-like predicted oxidoreductase